MNLNTVMPYATLFGILVCIVVLRIARGGFRAGNTKTPIVRPLSFRKKFWRTIWSGLLIPLWFLFPKSERILGLSRDTFILLIVIAWLMDAAYTYYKWKHDTSELGTAPTSRPPSHSSTTPKDQSHDSRWTPAFSEPDMKRIEMKVERRDIAVIALCAFGGFILVLVAIGSRDVAAGVFAGLLAGAPSGAVGGVLACMFLKRLDKK